MGPRDARGSAVAAFPCLCRRTLKRFKKVGANLSRFSGLQSAQVFEKILSNAYNGILEIWIKNLVVYNDRKTTRCEYSIYMILAIFYAEVCGGPAEKVNLTFYMRRVWKELKVYSTLKSREPSGDAASLWSAMSIPSYELLVLFSYSSTLYARQHFLCSFHSFVCVHAPSSPAFSDRGIPQGCGSST